MPLPARAALAALALVSLSACASAHARTLVPPALETPAPPVRMLVPAPPLEPVVEPAPATTPAATPAPPKPNPPASRTPERVNPPTVPTSSPPPDSPPAPVLQTTQNASELESRARSSIDVAQKNLAKVEPRSLGRELKDQFDQAQRFIALAIQQIAIKNFVRAVVLAENAAALAGQLVKDASR